MLTLILILAVWISSILALRKSADLKRQKTALLALSSRLNEMDSSLLQSMVHPRMADDFDIWTIHVPDDKSFELRFAIGEVSNAGMPQQFEKVVLVPGRHRITLHFADSADEGYHFTVFVDGQSVVERMLGRDWMPNGWNQSNGLNLPVGENRIKPALLQLAGSLYTPRTDYGPNGWFHGQVDNWVSGLGYRLWIDQAERTYEPTSPFMGWDTESIYFGIGLRDGLRYRASIVKQYEWTISRPASQTNQAVLTIVPEFFVDGQVVLSDQTKGFTQWHLRNEPTGNKALSWQRDPQQTAYIAFLHADVESSGATEPVVEVRWDSSRPNDMGLRLADTPANDELTRWRLRIIGGANHLWRLLDIGDRHFDVRENLDDQSQQSFGDPLPIAFDHNSDQPYHIAWRTNFTTPLQLLQHRGNKPNSHVGIDLFQGLPLAFGAEISRELQPAMAIVRTRSFSGASNIPIPDGPVIEETHIDLDATSHDWIWLRAEPQ